MYIHKTAGIYIYAYTYIRYNRKCIYKRFQQRKAVKEFRIWCQCNNPYGVACTSVRNIKCNRPIHHDYGVISLPNGQCV